ncbi:hypothetical protein [Chondromyces crocatus]|uniref:Secreted protein n=1 Tax=Chondromyces crocatus TaxID=52 RepID=A0A0K1EI71_CHOCO|nr:hypothetical protein [Chondromyces crocatus]AKT40288.1 uncharacterized protein CMC5_044410 [Chondromyces crocatus]
MRRSSTLSFALLSLLSLGACASGARPEATSPRPGGSSSITAGATSELGAQRGNTVAALTCPQVELAQGDARRPGLELLLGGQPREAVNHFSDLVRARPADPAAGALRDASEAALEARRASAVQRAEAVKPVQLVRLPLTRSSGSIGASGSKVTLTRESEKRNVITDTADWLQSNQLISRTLRGSESMPAHVGSTFRGQRLSEVFVSPDHDIALYRGTSDFLVVSAPGKTPRVYDVSAAVASVPSVRFGVDFAQLVGRTLLVQLAYNGYAKDAGGRTGYVVAFDAETGRLSWSSEPLTGNLGNFHVAGGSIVAGYGFTAEPDFLHVLDLNTGEITQKIPLKSGPTWILSQGNRLMVRTYDTDYVFRVEGTLPPAPPAELAAAVDAGTKVPPGAAAACWGRATVAALDRGDAPALAEAVQGLGQAGVEPAVVRALDVARARLDARARGDGLLDLTATPPVVLPAPPWTSAAPAPRPLPPGKAPTLVRLRSVTADPVREVETSGDPNEEDWYPRPFATRDAPPAEPPRDVPHSYGGEALRAVLRSGESRVLLYGGRYVVPVKATKVQGVFDLDAFRHPPTVNPQTKEFAVQNVTYAQAEGSVLHVCNGGGSYAREVGGKKGFLSAIEMPTGKLLWRSEPLLCNANFVSVGDYLVTGYGFTDEPDFLFLIRKADGKVMQRVKLDSAAHLIRRLPDGRLLVEAYGHAYLFEVKL